MSGKILILNGSPRRNGNTSLMVRAFSEGAVSSGVSPEVVSPGNINIQPCRGCLRCNLFKRCVIKGDDWPELSVKILESEILVFATPVYFHHMTAPLKMILDRFRSFVHVQITETGLIHTPWAEWNKRIILLTCMGSSSPEDAKPLEELFTSVTHMLGGKSELTCIAATRLAVQGQVGMTEAELAELYPKLKLPAELAAGDSLRNLELIERLREMGAQAAEGRRFQEISHQD